MHQLLLVLGNNPPFFSHIFREVGDLLKCCVCMSHFKDPVLLPCAHHICRDCMIGVLKQTRACPSCRLEFIHRQVLNEFTGRDVMGVLQGSFNSMGIPLTQTQVLPSPSRHPLLVTNGEGALNGNAMNRQRGRRRRRNRSSPITRFEPPIPFDKIPGPPEKNGDRSCSTITSKCERNMQASSHRISREDRSLAQRSGHRISRETCGYSDVPKSSGVVWQVPKDYDPLGGVESLPALRVGLACDVACRTWPGINAQGGAAVIQACNNDGTYNVRYVTDKRSERRVEQRFIQAKPDRCTLSCGQSSQVSTRLRRRMSMIVTKEEKLTYGRSERRPDPCQPRRCCTAVGSRLLPDGISAPLRFVENDGNNKDQNGVRSNSDEKQDDRNSSPSESFSVGDVVKVHPRRWPGMNKHGGVARVVYCHPNGTCDVKYIVESSRKENVSTAFLTASNVSPKQGTSGNINVAATKHSGRARNKIVLCVSGLSLQSKGKRKNRQGDIVSQFARNNSSICQLLDSFTPDVTHLVMAEENMKAPLRSMKYFRAIANGIWILSPSWLAASLKTGFPVEEDAYELLGCHKEKLEHAPRRSRTEHFSGKPPLFLGKIFTLSGSFGVGQCPKRRDLESLIIDSGGQLQESVGGRKAGIEVVRTLTPALLRSAVERNESPKWAIGTVEWLLDCIGNYQLFDISCPSTAESP